MSLRLINACIIGAALISPFIYVFLGGLTVRAVEHAGWDMTWREDYHEHSCRPLALTLWPLTLVLLLLIGGAYGGYNLSQWKSRHRSQAVDKRKM